MMTCQTFEPQIGDYVDGTLPDAARAAVETHLATCAACRSLAADFQAIRTSALLLEPQVPPPHVWTRLAAAIDAQPRRSTFGGWFAAWQPIAAIAMALLVTTSLWWIGGRLGPAASQPVRVDAGEPVESVGTTYQTAEGNFTVAITGMEQLTQAGWSTLDPNTADVLKANLTVIDQAIVDSRAGLATEPESDLAQESLFAALRHKVALLQDTLALINEMRKGNQEGAARIVSGLNQ